MSFLGSFNPVNIINNLIDPIKALAAGNISKAATSFTTIVTSGGLSTVSPQIKAALDPVIGKLYDPKLIPAVIGATTKIPLLNAGGAYSVGPQPFLGSIQLPPAPVIAPPLPIPAAYVPPVQPIPTQGVQPMGLDLSSILGTVSNIFGGGQNPVFDTLSGVAGLTAAAIRPPTPLPAPVPRVPVPVPRAGVPGGRSLFNRFPNLAAGLNALKLAGKNVTRSQLYSMLKRFGPDFLITAGILSAAAVAELMMAGPGRRRMNPANSKALRRAARRIKSFHRLCQHTDLIKTRRSAPRGFSRCGTCRKSPCRC